MPREGRAIVACDAVHARLTPDALRVRKPDACRDDACRHRNVPQPSPCRRVARGRPVVSARAGTFARSPTFGQLARGQRGRYRTAATGVLPGPERGEVTPPFGLGLRAQRSY